MDGLSVVPVSLPILKNGEPTLPTYSRGVRNFPWKRQCHYRCVVLGKKWHYHWIFQNSCPHLLCLCSLTFTTSNNLALTKGGRNRVADSTFSWKEKLRTDNYIGWSLAFFLVKICSGQFWECAFFLRSDHGHAYSTPLKVHNFNHTNLFWFQ